MVKSRAVLSALASLGVMFALGTGAAAAQAQYVVHSDVTPTVFKEKNWTGIAYGFNAGNIKCEQSGFSKFYNESDISSISIAPSIPHCKFFGMEMAWNYNGCTEVTTPTSKLTGTYSIACPAGKQIDISIAGGCHIYIPAQTPTNPTVRISQTEEKGIKSLLIQREVTGLTYNSTGGWCGASGTNGKIGGTGYVSGYKNEKFEPSNQHSISIGETP